MAKKNIVIDAESTLVPTQAKTLFERVQDFLNDQDWVFQSDEERQQVSFFLRIKDGSVRVVVCAAEAQNWSRIMVYVTFPTLVPELKRLVVADAITRINYVSLLGQLDLDMTDGELRVRSVLECDSFVGETMIDRAIRRATDMAEQYHAALLSVAFGNTMAKDVMGLVGRDDGATLQ